MRLARLAARWNAFWHAEASPLALAVFRILFAYCLWDEVPTTRTRSRFAVASDDLHLPYWDALPRLPEGLYEALHTAQLPLIALLGLGLATRFACGSLLAIQGYVFFADHLNFRNHPYFFLLLLLILMLSPAGQALSVDALVWARRRGRSLWEAVVGPPRPLTMQRLIQVQVCLVYVFAALHKLRPAYLDGRVLESILVKDLPARTSGEVLGPLLAHPLGAELLASAWLWMALAWITVFLELAIPIALWSRRARPAAILAGTVFHLTIAFTMEIHVFSYAVLASYLLFLEPETLPRLARRLVRRSGDRIPAGGLR